ncbi:MAG: N-acetylmuramoyl-L-alanine amidase [Deltaproteobacteria bacterium]
MTGRDRSLYLPILLLLALAGGCVSAPTRRPPSAVVPPPSPSMAYHTVEKGQTLWRIARMYGVDMSGLMAANGITDPRHVSTGQRLVIPGRSATPPSAFPPSIPFSADYTAIDRLVGHPYGHVRWRTITVHHSATRYGNARIFDISHRRRGMGGLFYHFLIGNGNGMGDGEIQVGRRWLRQSEVNRPQDIQICLVGNFMKQRVTDKQYDSLRKLIAVLKRRYNISGPYCLRRHRDVVRAGKATECPGRYFPIERLVQDTRGAQ